MMSHFPLPGRDNIHFSTGFIFHFRNVLQSLMKFRIIGRFVG